MKPGLHGMISGLFLLPQTKIAHQNKLLCQMRMASNAVCSPVTDLVPLQPKTNKVQLLLLNFRKQNVGFKRRMVY